MDKLNKIFKINPLYESDGYKISHKLMLAPGTTKEYWTWIPRNFKYMPKGIKKIMSGGQQLTWRYIHSNFQELFFNQPIHVAKKFGEDMSKYIMMEYNSKHFEELHSLGYLPIEIQSLPEGIFTKNNIPHMTGINTVDGYAWLGLFLETLVSKLSWQLPTIATIANKFKENAVEYVKKTDSENMWLADYMCHDFHSRGGNPFTSIAAGLGHAFSNKGSDTLNVIEASRYYYDVPDDEMCVNSVNASEHSVTCTGIFYYQDKLKRGLLNDKIKEYYSFSAPCEGNIDNPDYLAISEWLNLADWLKKFPKGILSIVSDTFDLWKLITFILPRLKDQILARDGKLVIRPDSGNPVDIICGRNYNIMHLRMTDYITNTPMLFSKAIKHKISNFDNYGNNNYWDDNRLNPDLIEFREKYFEYGENGYSGYSLEYYNQIKFNENFCKGVVQLLYEIFGGDKTKEGYIRLNSHVGVIYGDSITLDRQVEIYKKLEKKGFAATNIIVGVGSYSYVYMTRDQAGWAAKGAWFRTHIKTDCTCGASSYEGCSECLETKDYDIYKDPVTDDGTKKSLRGFQYVYYNKENQIEVESGVSMEKAFSSENLLRTIYKDGKFYNQTSLDKIRYKLSNNKM